MTRVNPADLIAELKKVSLTLEKSIHNNRLCQIEKDIALERLRTIYEALMELDFLPLEEQSDVLSAYLGDKDEKIDDYEDTKEEKKEKIHMPAETSNCDAPVATMEDLIEKPFSSHSPIARDLIESLYGDAELCKKTNDAPRQTEPCLPKKEEEKVNEPSRQVLHETFSGNTRDIASILSSQTNSQLRKAIGLNDRLMLMNDLFNNDSELCDQTLKALDDCHTIDDAYIYLYEHFALDNEKEGVKLLISLLESKFNR